ncbi:MAG TPA: GNAT family N-acetyltransferase [Methylococcaceae bacterium]|nr:GNAT family N-acetyltransferase [Methylococcaceae bacterium]
MRRVLLASALDLPEADWQSLDTGDDPFASRAFLGTAEQTRAAGEALGWRPMHLALRDGDNRLAGLLPLYLRQHSFGDFSEDWNWASAWQQRGLGYYPKLVSGIPFTPSPGPRLLARQGMQSSVGPALIAAAQAWVAEWGASSWQCLFVREAERDLLAAAGLLLRRGVQFHWLNRGYRDFADFLQGFTAEKRKKLKRERRVVLEAGLRMEARHGDEIDASLWTDIHRHYRNTFLRYGNHPAFSLEFFRRMGEGIGRRMVVFIAWQGGQAVASSICFRNQTTLFGRHWGTDIECPGLHFELCYYRGIEYAIAEGLQRFEPGAHGEHKLTRGFEPVPTWSAFWIADGRMRQVVANFLAMSALNVEMDFLSNEINASNPGGRPHENLRLQDLVRPVVAA